VPSVAFIFPIKHKCLYVCGIDENVIEVGLVVVVIV
jgi:hypothetical protein